MGDSKINQGLRIKWNETDFANLGAELDRVLKDMQTKMNANPINFKIGNFDDLKRQLDDLTKKVKEFQGTASNSNGNGSNGGTSITDFNKTAVNKAKQDEDYRAMRLRVNQIERDIQKAGGEISEVLVNMDAKTKAITGATLKYTDALGKMRTEVYKTVTEVDKDGKLTGVGLEKTKISEKNNIGTQQADNYRKAKTALEEIGRLEQNIAKLENQNGDLAKNYNRQLAERKEEYDRIRKSQIQIADLGKAKTENVAGINVQQMEKLVQLEEKQNRELAETKDKLKDLSNVTVPTTMSGRQPLENYDKVNIGEKINFTGKNTQDQIAILDKYAKAVGGVGAEWTKITPKLDSTGKQITEVSVRTKEGGKYWQNYSMILRDGESEVLKLNRGLSDISITQMGTFARLKEAFSGITMWTIATKAIYGVINAIKDGIAFINELDKAQTNIAIVTGKNRNEIDALTNSYVNLSSQLRVSVKDTMSGAEEFLRAGKSALETQEMVKQNMVASKLSGQDAKATSEQMIAMSNGFERQFDAMGIGLNRYKMIVDSLSTIDNQSATSFKEISEAMKRTASSADMAGVGFQRLGGYIAVVSDRTRKSAESIGESFKTIFARLQAVSKGKAIDDEGESINGVEKALDRVNIKLRENATTWRSEASVFDEINSKWKTMSKTEQSYVAQQIAGTRQRENFLVLMNNYDKALELERAQLNGNGTSWERYQKYVQSTEGRIQEFKNTLEKMYLTMINSTAIKATISTATGLLKVLGDWKVIVIGLTVLITHFFGETLQALYLKMVTQIGVTEAYITKLFLQASAEGIVSTATGVLTSAMIELGGVMMANPVVALATVAMGAVFLSEKFNLLKNDIKDLENVNNALGQIDDQFQKSQNVDSLTKSYERLKGEIDSNKFKGEELSNKMKELVDTEKQLANILPEATTGYTDNNEAITTNIAKVKELNELKKKTATEQYLVQAEILKTNLVNHTLNEYKEGREDVRKINKGEFSFSSLDKASKKYQTGFDTITKYNEIIMKLSQLGMQNQQIVNLQTGAFESLDSQMGRTTTSGQKFADAWSKASGVMQETAESTKEVGEKQKEATSKFESTTKKIEDYRKILSELDQKHKLTGESVKDIFKNYPELLANLGNEKAMREQLISTIKKEESTQREAYINMLAQSNDFYNSKVKGNANMENEINKIYQQAVGEHGKGYRVDLQNFSTVENMKGDITAHIINSMLGNWKQYYDQATGQFDALNAYIDSTHMDMTERIKKGLTLDSLSQTIGVGGFVEQANRARREAMRGIDKVIFDPIHVDFSPINTSGEIKGHADNSAEKARRKAEQEAEKAQREAEERERDYQERKKRAYDEIANMEKKLTEIIKKQVEERKKAIKDEFDTKKKAIDEQKELYNRQNTEDDYQKNLKKEQQALAEIQTAIKNAERDKSESNQARILEMKKQEQQQKQVIEDMILNRGRDLNNQRFDDEKKKLDNQAEDLLKKLDVQYSDENIKKMAKDAVLSGYFVDVNGKITNVTSAYIDFEKKFGDGLLFLGKRVDDFNASLSRVQQLINSMSGNDLARDVIMKVIPKNKNEGEPSFDVGINQVPYNMRARIHEGELITPKKFNPFNPEGYRNLMNSIFNKNEGNRFGGVSINNEFKVQGDITKDALPTLKEIVEIASQKTIGLIKKDMVVLG